MGKIRVFDNRKVVEEMDIIKRIKKNGTREKEVLQALQKKNGSAWEEDKVAYMEGRIYIPNNKDIKGEILREHHDPADVGYLGQHRIQELIKRTYWWPGLKEDVKKYVQGYVKCQQNKVQHQRKAGELHPLKIPEGPWQDISIDMIGPLPRLNKMDTILVIVDCFTKMIRLKATTTSLSSEGVTKIYRDEIWKIHRIPKMILSNRGPQFASKFIEDLTRVLGTKRKLSTAYHPQTDGQTEIINQEIGIFLRHYVNYQQDDWMEWLATAEFAYNDKKHTVTGKTLFKQNFGRHPWKGDLMVQSELPQVEEFAKKLQESWEHAAQAMREAQKNMKQQFDKKRSNPQGLKVGDHVWLENKNI